MVLKYPCKCCGHMVTRKQENEHIRKGGKISRDALVSRLRVEEAAKRQETQMRRHLRNRRTPSPARSNSDVEMDGVASTDHGDTMHNTSPTSPHPAPSMPTTSFPHPQAHHNTGRSLRIVVDDEESDSDISDASSNEDLTFADPDSSDDDDTTDPDVPAWQQGMAAYERIAEEWELKRLFSDLSADDKLAVQAHNWLVSSKVGSSAYEKLRVAFPGTDLVKLLSEKSLQTRIVGLSDLKPIPYDCCINGCCCYTEQLAAEEKCPFCDEDRYEGPPGQRRARRVFHYIPLIPRLVNLFLDPEFVKLILEMEDYPAGLGNMQDIHDGWLMRYLKGQRVTVNEEILAHHFFSQISDLALGLATDGFSPFRRRGKKSCWPIILFIYNLPPAIRFHLSRILCVGVIPGHPKDIDSYLVPLVEELELLAWGVPALDILRDIKFVLHAYLIVVFGDMPAVSKLMRMKGVNGKSPCRSCHIHAVRDPARKGNAHYTPLVRDGEEYDPEDLPLRTHKEFLRNALHVATAPTQSEAEKRSKLHGHNGIPILSRLSSLRFPDSFPHDCMHLVIENVFKTLLDLWTGPYKGLDTGIEDYRLSSSVLDAVGRACAESGDTIPSVFGCRVPDIAQDRHEFIAESWLLFMTLLAPGLLNHHFKKDVYYDHFVQLIKLFNICLQLEYTEEDIVTIENGFADWVKEYERIYYQYNKARLPVCTLPIHGLLHIGRDIRNLGPIWAYWAFPIERFCGALKPFARSKQHQSTSIAHRIRNIEQQRQLKVLYPKDVPNLDGYSHIERVSAQVVGDYGESALVMAPKQSFEVTATIRKKIAAHLAVNFPLTKEQAAMFVPEHVMQWGKVWLKQTGAVVQASEGAPTRRRDASFVKYELDVDKRAHHPRQPALYENHPFYSQVQHILAVDLGRAFPFPPHASSTILLLALVAPAILTNINKLGQFYYQNLRREAFVVDVSSFLDVVSRVRVPAMPGRPARWMLLEKTGAPQVLNSFGEVVQPVLPRA